MRHCKYAAASYVMLVPALPILYYNMIQFNTVYYTILYYTILYYTILYYRNKHAEAWVLPYLRRASQMREEAEASGQKQKDTT